MHTRFILAIWFFVLVGLFSVAGGTTGYAFSQLAQNEQTIPHPEEYTEFDDENYEEPQFFIDPRQIQDALRQIKDLGRRIKEVNKLARKYGTPADVETLSTIAVRLSEFKNVFNSEDMEAIADVMQDFHDSNYWEQINEIDQRIRIPKEIADLKKALSRSEKLLNRKNKQLQTVKSVLGLNTDVFTEFISRIKGIVTEADQIMQGGDFEGAGETLQELYNEGLHPGSIEGMIHELTGIAMNVKKIKNQNIVSQIKTLISEPFALFESGDLQGANEAWNDVRDDINRLMQQGFPSKKRLSSSILNFRF